MKKFGIFIAISAIFSFLLIQTVSAACCTQEADLFPDVQIGHEYYDQINYLNREEIFIGSTDGNFYPDDPLNRAEFATIVVRLSGAEPDVADYNNCFPDVADDWYAAPVCFAQAQGWVQGYGAGDPAEGTYGPDNPVQDIEVLMILSRFSDWSVEEGGEWYDPALSFALATNIYDAMDPIMDITREKTADVMFRDLATTPFGHETYSDDLKEELFNNNIADLVTIDIVEPPSEELPTETEILIAQHETQKTIENDIVNTYMPELYYDAFYGMTGEPQMMPCMPIFNPGEGINFNFTMGLEGDMAKILNIQAILYDMTTSQWVYGYNADLETSYFNTTNINDFADDFSLTVHELYDPVSEEYSPLVHVDPAMGYLLHVKTDDAREFIVGNDDIKEVAPEDNFQDLSDGTISNELGEGTAENKCPDVDVLGALQGAFTAEGVTMDTSNLDTEKFESPMECGKSISSVIRLGGDLAVLPSHEEIGRRVAEDDIPEGGFRGAHYLLVFNLYSYCNTRTWECEVLLTYRLIEVQTGIIKEAGYIPWFDKDELQGEFGGMLDETETAVSENENSAQELH
ncbi:S-layer homology domain-containing protein [Patescibacteria group bacterium]